MVSEGVTEYMEEVAFRTNLFLKERENPVAYTELQSAIDTTRTSLDEETPEDQYDELKEADIRASLDTTEAFAAFYTEDEDYDISVQEMTDLFCGDGTYEALKAAVEEGEWEEQYRQREHYEDRSRKSATVDSDLWATLMAETERVEDIVVEYSQQEELMPDDFEYHTTPFEKSETTVRGGGRAHWNSEHRELRVNPQSLHPVRDGDTIIVDPTLLVNTLFHELNGHGVHQYRSEQDEYPGFPGTGDRPASIAHKEGIAQFQEQHVGQFLEEYRDELMDTKNGLAVQITDELCDVRRLRTQITPQAHDVYKQLVVEEDYRGEIDSAADKLAQYYPRRHAEKVANRGIGDMFETLKEAGYAGGTVLMDKVDAEDRSPDALTRGVWTPQVLPDAVDYFESQ